MKLSREKQKTAITLIIYASLVGILVNTGILWSDNASISLVGNTYLWAAYFYNYTALVFVFLVMAGLGVAIFFRLFSGESKKTIALKIGIPLVGVFIGLCSTIGLLTRTSHVDTVGFEEQRYLLAKRHVFDFSDAFAWSYMICECDKLGFKCQCSYIDREDYSETFTSPRFVVDEGSSTLMLQTDEANYSLVDECDNVSHHRPNQLCPRFFAARDVSGN